MTSINERIDFICFCLTLICMLVIYILKKSIAFILLIFCFKLVMFIIFHSGAGPFEKQSDEKGEKEKEVEIRRPTVCPLISSGGFGSSSQIATISTPCLGPILSKPLDLVQSSFLAQSSPMDINDMRVEYGSGS